MSAQETLRHFLAALAYRLQKSIREAPESYWEFEAGGEVRTPRRILRHINSVLTYALLVLQTGDFHHRTRLKDLDPEGEIARFHTTLEALDHELSNRTDLSGDLLRRLLQGPLADAMTHIGQLAQLRRLAGSPVRGENFVKADIRTGHVGPDQPDPVSPDPE
ncbi:MAG: hypothetical protein C4332_16260 [Meiothermus sp.]